MCQIEMPQVLNFQSTPRASFLRGIAKGMAAPFLLYGDFSSVIAVPQVQTVRPERLRPQARNDWEAIGGDMRMALLRYEQEQR